MKEIKFIPPYRVDATPKLNKNAYEVLDNFSQHKDKATDDLTNDQFLDREALNDIYKDLQKSKNDLLKLLADLERQGVISSNDKLFTSCLFLISQELGDNLEGVSAMIDENNIDMNLVSEEIEATDLPVNSKQAFKEVVYRIYNHFYDLKIREKI